MIAILNVTRQVHKHAAKSLLKEYMRIPIMFYCKLYSSIESRPAIITVSNWHRNYRFGAVVEKHTDNLPNLINNMLNNMFPPVTQVCFQNIIDVVQL